MLATRVLPRVAICLAFSGGKEAMNDDGAE